MEKMSAALPGCFLNYSHPGVGVQVPLDGLADSPFEGVGGAPAKLSLDSAGVNRITAVVPRAVLIKLNQLSGLAAQVRCQFVQEIADQVDNGDVTPFVASTNVVRLPCPPPGAPIITGMSFSGN